MTREDWAPRRRASGSPAAGVLLLLAGAWQVAIGYAAAAGVAFAVTGYWYRADNPGWGWVNVAIGLAAIGTGVVQVGAVRSRRLGRLRGAAYAGLVVAVVSAMHQCFLAAQYPLWATVVIAIDVFVIWALTTGPGAGREAGPPDR
ncbi:DUF7144 family membrane protein [Glycomyces albidus]|uniref:DUF7144 family membrane protein n=1 Tax=Glycomyces albidus TaxID=2656774 RepID=UPI0018834D07|nr:hypothetical protein [Glycomyces albidus]